MNATMTLQELHEIAKGEYRLLIQQAEDLLRDFDLAAPDGGADFIARRDETIGRIQDAVSLLDSRETTEAERQQVEEFETFRREATGRILELDALVIGLAKQRQAEARTRLSGISKSRSAVAAYGETGKLKRY